ncbi:MAG: tRNA U-34 5-methylaminomethyl-2-thiouridine biosynthesis protein, partial [Minwuiales bacterium]|nr:tRNA U-34 5-methylaminomethyl-2-thiouridine biosynthesis protein [Minwuiales bacterium]
MTVVSAFLVPGTPLPLLRPDNPPWAPLVAGYQAAGE